MLTSSWPSKSIMVSDILSSSVKLSKYLHFVCFRRCWLLDRNHFELDNDIRGSGCTLYNPFRPLVPNDCGNLRMDQVPQHGLSLRFSYHWYHIQIVLNQLHKCLLVCGHGYYLQQRETGSFHQTWKSKCNIYFDYAHLCDLLRLYWSQQHRLPNWQHCTRQRDALEVKS